MKVKKYFVCLLLIIALLVANMSMMVSATDDAPDGQSAQPEEQTAENTGDIAIPPADENEYITDNAIIITAGTSGTTVSGEGTQTETIEVQQKSNDEFVNDRVDEMAEKFGEDYSGEIVYVNNGVDLNDVQTSEYTGSLYDYYSGNNDDRLPLEDPEVLADENGQVIVEEDLSIPNAQLAAFAQIYADFENALYDFEMPEFQPELWLGEDGKACDLCYGPLQYTEYMAQYLRDMITWIHHDSARAMVVSYMTEYPSLDALFSYLGGNVRKEQVGDSELYVGVPIVNSVLYDSLLSYISALHDIGIDSSKIKRYTVYSASSYRIGTIRYSTPVYPLQYHWTVSNTASERAIDEWTESQPYIRVVFESAGDYYVKVEQKKNVTRNNWVYGYKSEIWVLNNGDMFDGLVFYNDTSTFEAFVSDDIGPKIETVQLTEDSFIATVTNKMTGMTQMIDMNGYLHSASSGFSTERQ